jgi:hypothetical protein
MSRRHVLIALAMVGAALATPPAASATLTEIGTSVPFGRASCPDRPCLAVSRTTGFQELAIGRRNVYLVPRTGTLVAWTVSLGRPSASQIRFFDQNLGGRASGRITVLRPFRRRGNNYRFVVRNQSDIVQLQPYFGRTAQFALRATFPVYRNDLIAFSTSTWAPVLQVGLGENSTWRASRGAPCDDTFRQTAQRRIGSLAQYACLYRTARVAYSATLISTP